MATLDQANALYIQRRKRDALPLYDFLYRRWPDLLKKILMRCSSMGMPSLKFRS